MTYIPVVCAIKALRYIVVALAMSSQKEDFKLRIWRSIFIQRTNFMLKARPLRRRVFRVKIYIFIVRLVY